MKPAVLTDKVPGVQVDSIARQMTELVAPLYKLVGVTLERYVDIDIPTISASSAGIASIILELLTNSLKACEPDDSVRIKTVLEAGDIVIEISDTARRSIDKSSGKLRTRSSLSSITENPGSGLGLDMIERIARAHGSQIEAETRYSKGSIYRLRLPISYAEKAARLPISYAEKAAGAQSSAEVTS
jgi:two-component system sensor histidine kinase AdeS